MSPSTIGVLVEFISTCQFKNLLFKLYEKRNDFYPQFTDHCFTGEYPVEPEDVKETKFKKKETSLLFSKN